MINADFVFYGVTINVDVRVCALSYQYKSPKEWRFNVSMVSQGNELPSSKSYNFEYKEGSDPLKQAYQTLKDSGDFTNMADI